MSAASVLASGRKIGVTHGWNSADIAGKSAFLHDAHAGACTLFHHGARARARTSFHYNHVHIDLAMHGNTSRGPRRYCKPVPGAQIPPPQQDTLPDPPPIEEEMDIARSPMPRPSYAETGTSFVASAPPPPPVVRSQGMAGPSTRAPLALAPMSGPSQGLDLEQAGGGPLRPEEGRPADWDLPSSSR